MSAQYITMLEQLQVVKKELSNLRNKYIQVQCKNGCYLAQNNILKDQDSSNKRGLNLLRENNQNLSAQNLLYKKENERVMEQYERQILGVKMEINRKQESIRQLQLAMQTYNFNNALLRKQIECQVQQNFNQQINLKDLKIEELKAKLDSMKRQKEIEVQKNVLKIKSLENSLQQAEAKHMQEIKDYANRLYEQSLRKTVNSDDSMLKRMRRELDSLRNMLMDKDNQIQVLMGQKTQMMQQKSLLSVGDRRQKQQLLQTVTNYKRDLERVRSQQSLLKVQGENRQIRNYEREIKRYKDEMDRKDEQLNVKNLQIQEFKLKQKQLNQQIQQVVHQSNRKANLKFEEIMNENNRLKNVVEENQQELRHLQQRYNNVVSNNEFVEYRNDANVNEVSNKNYRNVNNKSHVNRQESHNENENISHVNKKNIVNETNITEQKNIKNIKKIINENIQQGEDKRVNVKKMKAQRDGEEQYERQNSPIGQYKVERERQKVREIARKYIDLQKKYDRCKNKLDQANNKVLQLLRNKIAMVSPPKTINQGMLMNSHGRLDPEAYESHKRGLFGSDKVNSTGNNFYRSTSPKNNKFYQKSLSFKSKSKNKTKDLKCINHDHSGEQCDDDY